MMGSEPRSIRKHPLDGRMALYEIEHPHPPEIPAFERKQLQFYTIEPKGGVNSETIPLMILPINVYGPDGFIRSLFTFLASRMNALIFTVEYLGTKTINRNSSWFENWKWDQATHAKTEGLLEKLGYPKFGDLKFQSVPEVINYLGRLSSQKRPGQEPPILATYIREPDDHYDSGVIQAIDCLWAIQVLKSEYPMINWAALTTIGTSRGGYLSTQCVRFAPNTFALSVSGFGPTKPRLDFIRKCDYHHVFHHPQSDVLFAFGMDSYWSMDPRHPFFFSPDRTQIRTLDDVDLLNQWRQQTRGGGAQHVFFQPVDDDDHPAGDTIRFVRDLRRAGMDVKFVEQQGYQQLKENSIDGFSLAGFVLENVTKENLEKHAVVQSDFDLKSQIVYRCKEHQYKIDFRGAFPKLEVSQLPVRDLGSDQCRNESTQLDSLKEI
jgi:hypothetical protein